jgi:hypothetical protein
MQPKEDAAVNSAVDKSVIFSETQSEWGDGRIKVKEYPSLNQ